MSARIVKAVTVIVGLFMVVFGLWALFAPASFAKNIASFDPYNVHLLHDVGAFQVGLGACLLLALVWSDALLVVLAGVGIGAILHAWAHVEDRALGGKPTDPLAIGFIAVLLVVAAVLRARQHRDD